MIRLNKNKTIIVVATLVFVLLICIYSYFRSFAKKDENISLTATKSVQENGESYKIKYKIKIKDYIMKSAIKEITFETEEKAQLEYNKYNIINEYERKGYEVQIKNKTLTLNLTQELFIEDIEYDTASNIILVDKNNQETEILNQEEIINALINQGYEIK